MAIVVGYVATREGEAAVKAAIELVRERGGSLVVVASEHSSRRSAERDAEHEDQRDKLRARLDEAAVRYEIRVTSRNNDVADDILEIVEDVNADLVVIGLRRRSPVGKLILGSNAQRILLDAPCPVLAVKA